MSRELIDRLRAGVVWGNSSLTPSTMKEAADMIEQQAAESLRLQYICGSAYQMAGALDAPERFLDALSDPVSMTQEQIDALLPITGDEIYEAVTRLQSERADYDAATSVAPADRNAVLEEVAAHFDATHRELWCPEIVEEILALKDSAAPVVPDDKRDAERYRWLRDSPNNSDCLNMLFGYLDAPHQIDRAIDAAIDAGMAAALKEPK